MKTKYKKTKDFNAIAIAFFNAMAIVIIFPIVFYVCSHLLKLTSFVSLILSMLFTVMAVFIATYYWIDVFLYNKIKLIYKIILDFKISKDTKKEWKKDKFSIKDAEKDAQLFIEKKDNEMEHLRKLEAYRKDFLSSVSHELKTPLTSIQGYVLTLLDGGLSDETINYKYLHKASKNIDRLIAIVEDLEVITKLESNELKLNIEKFDLYKLLQESLALMEIQSKQHNVHYEIKADYEKSYMVHADKKHIQIVFFNLINNAMKYNDKDEKRIKITFFDMGENYLIEITDNGIGIDNQHIPRLFERFYRVSKDRSREMGGSGLGLAIVKHIVEAHGSSIHIRSTPDIGSTFSFPLKK